MTTNFKQKKIRDGKHYPLSDNYPASGASVCLPKPLISASVVMAAQDLSLVTISQSPFVAIATKHNIEENAPSIRTWIKSTSWHVTYGNIQDGGRNAF